ncbi:alkane hydroxylase MAH1-like [Neltuma alba]|uniref:alkane hydroxylase MAH1-like n=1 Tax=Neltuma alba TaxID=207710 RepID=UPI0010A564F8|nr:alkane hydroxylase MAH1-like [Prosopis alba]
MEVLVISSDLGLHPKNVHHMMSKNFANYIKGPELREDFEAFGDGILTTDSDAWKYHRTLLHSLLKTKSFGMILEKNARKKVEIGRNAKTSALTWFFWFVGKHPSVEAKILEEIKEEKEEQYQVYLHGALCEALRLYPPVPFERNEAIKHDVLPSGHEVGPGTKIMSFLYAMGRSEEAWGKDCLEFRPERWISERGSIVHIPSFKFVRFNAGARTCLGKDLSFMQMKIVASSILRNYQAHVVEDHPISPPLSIIFLMKYGLKVRITERVIYC